MVTKCPVPKAVSFSGVTSHNFVEKYSRSPGNKGLKNSISQLEINDWSNPYLSGNLNAISNAGGRCSGGHDGLKGIMDHACAIVGGAMILPYLDLLAYSSSV
jgi:hypothetical protein